ncbi:MAG TPA: SRPBCC family protein, partial [Candidatus Obscuribacterales bacterium]
MKAIEFVCRRELSMSPEQICAEILTLENWPSFKGYGPVPGIESAEFLTRTEDLTGSRIAVRNRDGSHHVEEIVAWDGRERLVMHMKEFSPPLSKLADHFEEHWRFEPLSGNKTRVERRFLLYARDPGARLILGMISIWL